jgi:NADPH-dependent curcumin reductase CurA
MRAVSRQWRLAAHPDGLIKPGDFRWHEEPLRELRDGEVLVRVEYLSLDPTNRIWANGQESYLPPVQIGEVMRGIGTGVIDASRNASWAVGTRVSGRLGWQSHVISDGRDIAALPAGVEPTLQLGLLGHIGITAYFALLDLGRPQPGETVVVTGAAGAVGSLAGQIAKLHGCRVVGITGSADKCRWITEDLGFDAAINYKTEDVAQALEQTCPKGIDVDFENVGGPILDAILSRANLHARIVICGLIAQYNARGPVPGPTNFDKILIQRLRVEGFMLMDYRQRSAEAVAALLKWHQQGKLKFRLDVVEGLGNAPVAVNKLFDGSNAGKLVVKL